MRPHRRDSNTWHVFSEASVPLHCSTKFRDGLFSDKTPSCTKSKAVTGHKGCCLSSNTVIKNIFSQRTHGNLFKYLDYPFKSCVSYTGDKYLLSLILESLKTRFLRERAIVIKALSYKPEGCGFETMWGELMFLIYLILHAALDPGVHSASNRFFLNSFISNQNYWDSIS
jgi:hypothetical protein